MCSSSIRDPSISRLCAVMIGRRYAVFHRQSGSLGTSGRTLRASCRRIIVLDFNQSHLASVSLSLNRFSALNLLIKHSAFINLDRDSTSSESCLPNSSVQTRRDKNNRTKTPASDGLTFVPPASFGVRDLIGVPWLRGSWSR
jgi:hypothetical protein